MLIYRKDTLKCYKLVLFVLILLSVFCACSRRDTYEELLESQKEAESLDAIPETNGNITGESAPDYATPVMLKTGSTPFYEGKTLDDLTTVFKNTGKISFSPNMLPTGRIYDGNDTPIPYFYNKLTGNFSKWCSDPLCDGAGCIWETGTLYLQYVSDEYIYFMADTGMDEYGLYRCDFQRNNMEKIKDIAIYSADGRAYRDEVKVVYEKDDVLYICWTHYVNTNSVHTLYTYDVNTHEEKTISGNLDLEFVTIVQDQIFYSTRKEPYTLYKTNLSFENQELFWKDVVIEQYNDHYLIVREASAGGSSSRRYSYNLKTGEQCAMNDILGDIYLSGEYVYYMRDLIEDEMENDPLTDYYTYTWQREARPGSSVIRVEDAKVKSAGKIYRIHVGADYASEECVFQLTYKGIPVRIKEIEMDGDVIYITFHNYEMCKNYYNQEFANDEEKTVCHGLVDLQNGTVTLLELPQEE